TWPCSRRLRPGSRRPSRNAEPRWRVTPDTNFHETPRTLHPEAPCKQLEKAIVERGHHLSARVCECKQSNGAFETRAWQVGPRSAFRGGGLQSERCAVHCCEWRRNNLAVDHFTAAVFLAPRHRGHRTGAPLSG